MEYSNIGRGGKPVSRLGFGCMRLPLTPEGKIDEPRAAAMLDTAYKAGVTYFDTAFFYHQRTSEAFVGKTMKRYPRESFNLATKLPLAIIHTLDEAKEIFEGQFVSLQTDYFDFYLLHALNAERWQLALDEGIVDFLAQQQKLGRIRNLGFSFHDSYEVFERIVTARAWDFCQIQLNYMDIDEQAGMRGYELTQKLGIPLIVMEPVKGGSLASLPEDIAGKLKEARPEKSIASWAMRWVGSLENCRVILSGMTAEDQVEDNLATFQHFEPISDAEAKLIDETRDALRRRVFVGCTACSYCMPCPFGVDIPGNFRLMNDYEMYRNERALLGSWNFLGEDKQATQCKKCGKCEQACPQAIPIRGKLAEIASVIAEKKK